MHNDPTIISSCDNASRFALNSSSALLHHEFFAMNAPPIIANTINNVIKYFFIKLFLIRIHTETMALVLMAKVIETGVIQKDEKYRM